MNRNNGGAAFPQMTVDMGRGPENPDSYAMGGMSLRDWFAGMALAGLASAHDNAGNWTGSTSTGCTAEEAYRLADSMIEEREG